MPDETLGTFAKFIFISKRNAFSTTLSFYLAIVFQMLIIFCFLAQVATRTWSPNQGKSREMTKLCNHKRKLVIPLTGVNLIGPTVVSSSTASAGQASRIPETHTNADLLSSSDKNKPGKLTSFLQ